MKVGRVTYLSVSLELELYPEADRVDPAEPRTSGKGKEGGKEGIRTRRSVPLISNRRALNACSKHEQTYLGVLTSTMGQGACGKVWGSAFSGSRHTQPLLLHPPLTS